MRLIYLGSPYSHPDPIQKTKRVSETERCLAHFKSTAKDVVLYSPIAHWHSIAVEHKISGDFDDWAQQDFFMIRKSSALWVLTIEGWDMSYGLSQELEYATDISKPIMYVVQDSVGYHLRSDRPD